jgi:hypothetical protein
MFFQNLKTIRTHVDMLLSKSPEELDKILKQHDWASEHMSTAKDDIEEVCNFFTNGYVSESEGPCWKGYEQIGMKKKNGKEVPNCVPIKEGKPEMIEEAEYQGRTVELNKPTQGDVKKFKVYVKNDKGNVVKVNFGQKGMVIKKDNPERRKSFRARHNCDNPGPKWKARYWSCKKW